MDPLDVMTSAFSDELQKIAASKLETARKAAPYVAGALGFETLRRANSDRKMGRAMRRQQGQF